MTEETRFVTSRDGARIADHVSGEGPPLVLVYGALSDRTYWRRLAPFLGGFQLHAMERRGRGESDRKPGYSVDDEVADVTAVIAAIGDPAYVFAHSSGAVLALLAAQNAPQNVRRVALYEPPMPVGAGLRSPVATDLADRLDAFVRAGLPELAMETFFREGPELSEADIERQRTGQLWQSLTPLANTMSADARINNEYDLSNLADAAFNVPTLLLYGETSPAWVTESVKLLAAGLGDAKAMMLAGQGHVAAFTAPEVLANAMRAFFEVD